MVTVEAGGVEDDRSVLHLSYVPAPEVTVEKRWENLNVVKERRHPSL